MRLPSYLSACSASFARNTKSSLSPIWMAKDTRKINWITVAKTVPFKRKMDDSSSEPGAVVWLGHVTCDAITEAKQSGLQWFPAQILSKRDRQMIELKTTARAGKKEKKKEGVEGGKEKQCGERFYARSLSYALASGCSESLSLHEVQNFARFNMAPAWQQMKPALSHQTLRCIDKLGFKTMTPVQVWIIEVDLWVRLILR